MPSCEALQYWNIQAKREEVKLIFRWFSNEAWIERRGRPLWAPRCCRDTSSPTRSFLEGRRHVFVVERILKIWTNAKSIWLWLKKTWVSKGSLVLVSWIFQHLPTINFGNQSVCMVHLGKGKIILQAPNRKDWQLVSWCKALLFRVGSLITFISYISNLSFMYQTRVIRLISITAGYNIYTNIILCTYTPFSGASPSTPPSAFNKPLFLPSIGSSSGSTLQRPPPNDLPQPRSEDVDRYMQKLTVTIYTVSHHVYTNINSMSRSFIFS